MQSLPETGCSTKQTTATNGPNLPEKSKRALPHLSEANATRTFPQIEGKHARGRVADRSTTQVALSRWARQLADNHKSTLPSGIKSHEDLGDVLTFVLGAYLSDDIGAEKFRDVCGWALVFLKNVELQRGERVPLKVVRR